MRLLRRIADLWDAMRYGPRCEKHPGHRMYETNFEGGMFCHLCLDDKFRFVKGFN